MAFDLSSIQLGAPKRPPLIVIHGTPGVGKTTFAAGAESPIFIRTEDGLGTLDVPTFPLAYSIDDVLAALAALHEQEHDYQTIVIDSLSALEPMIWRKVAQDQGKKSIEDIGYGKGYIYAMDYWHKVILTCRSLASNRSLTPVLIAHSEVVKFDAPDSEAYDRYQIKLHKRAFAHLYEQADIIGFAHEPVYVRRDGDTGPGKGKSKGQRLLRLVSNAAIIAKNRYSMPETVNLSWDEFAQHIPFLNKE